MQDGESQFNNRPQEDIELEKSTTHRSWRKYTVYYKRPYREVKAECRQRKQQNLGHLSLLWSVVGVIWGSWARFRLVSSKEQSFSKRHRRLT